MSATVLVPSATEVHALRATREPGPPEFCFHAQTTGSMRTAADRVRAGLANAGLSFPTGRVDVELDPSWYGLVAGLDLGLALAVLLVDPAHRSHVRSGIVAWGAVHLDGTLGAVEADLIAELPPEPWVGRFWHPTDEIPAPDDDAVISIVPVYNLVEAWEGLLGLNQIEQSLAVLNN